MSRLPAFLLVGGIGFLVNAAAAELLTACGLRFWMANPLAILTAMLATYLLNNRTTYRDLRRTGRSLVLGFLPYAGVCGVGAVVNALAAALFHTTMPAFPGLVTLSVAVGSVAGAAFNFIGVSRFVWRT